MPSRLIVAASVIAAVALTAVPAPAQTAPAPGTQAAPAAEAEDITVIKKRQKRVCKSSVATGSIMPKRVCKSAAEWDEITERSVAEVERMRYDHRTRQWIKEMGAAEQ